MLMSDYIHKDDAYEWLRDKEIQFAEDDFAKVQAERDALKAKVLELQTELDRITREYSRGV
jgi:predicted  nucleic acid-binding Zn-ribbon protein